MIKNKIKKIALVFLGYVLLVLPKIAAAQWSAGLSNAEGSGLPEEPIYAIVENIMYWLLGLVGIAGVIGFAISGLMYLTSAGNDDQMGTAKKAMTYSIIGVIVALSGLIVVVAIDSMLNVGNEF